MHHGDNTHLSVIIMQSDVFLWKHTINFEFMSWEIHNICLEKIDKLNVW